MALYFIDTEFIEHATGIELLSIGIVCEDGRTFYAENTAVDYRLADDWVKENVISKLRFKQPPCGQDEYYIKSRHKDNPKGSNINDGFNLEMRGDYSQIKEELLLFIDDNPTFYAYYADYDWVVFCKIFGRMIDLPKHFPLYCRDLKQSLDEFCEREDLDWIFAELEAQEKDITSANILNFIKEHKDYPTQDNKHNSLDDALFNKKLYYFLQNL